MTEIDMEKICDILKRDYKIPAYVEQTGGGTATIMAGETFESVETHDLIMDGVKFDTKTSTVTRYPALAGPGWFRGPGWSNAIGDLGDFYIGPDDDGLGRSGVNDLFRTAETLNEDDVARIIAGVVNDDIQEHATQWGTLSFFPDKTRGAFYTAAGNRVGELFAPMRTDGSMLPDEITSIEFTYEEA